MLKLYLETRAFSAAPVIMLAEIPAILGFVIGFLYKDANGYYPFFLLSLLYLAYIYNRLSTEE